jgi:SpoVK/Ycf46/Vps4 family AAA+-type ATPase
MQEGMRTFQRSTQQGLEATEQTEEVLQRTEEAARQEELKVADFGALKTTNYEDLTVEDIVKQLDGLTIQQLEQVREYEKQNKDRETLIEQIDRKIRTKNS